MWHVHILVNNYPDIVGIGTLVWTRQGESVAAIFGLREYPFPENDNPPEAWLFLERERKDPDVVWENRDLQHIFNDNRFAPLYETDGPYYDYIDQYFKELMNYARRLPRAR